MNEKLDKVYDEFRENNMWDDIYVEFGADKDGDEYAIFESWEDLNKFVAFAKKVLDIPEEDEDYEVERELEINFVFSDEYSKCYDCSTVIRTSPDSYGWQPDFYYGDEGLFCKECFDANEDLQESYIEEKINNPKSAINGIISEEQLENLGFEKFNHDSFENGWYEGQTDDPQAIYNKLSEKYNEIIFYIDGVGQFDLHFSVYVRGEIENEED